MSPSLALRVTWFILSLTAIPASWLVLVTFSMTTGVWWAQMLYGVVVTFLEGIFALGMIWKMRPMDMPRAFCLAQAIIPATGGYFLSGICACLTLATYATVFNPKHGLLSHGRSSNPLAWKHVYIVFVGIWPLLATAAFLTVSIKYDAFQPTDDLHCDATHPLWPRLLSYAGAPLLVAIPCLGVSAVTFRRILKVSAEARIIRTRHQEQNTRLSPMPMTAKDRRKSTQPSHTLPRRRPSSLRLQHSSRHEKTYGLSVDQRGYSTLTLPRSAASLVLPPSPGTVDTAALSEATHVSPDTSMPPPPPFAYHRRASSSPTPSRDSSPSPLTFAPVRNNLRRPSAAPDSHSMVYTPSFDPGSFEWPHGSQPVAVSLPTSPVSPSRERVSFDVGDVAAAGFHLPRRPSIDFLSRRPSMATLAVSTGATSNESQSEPTPESHLNSYSSSGCAQGARWYPDKTGLKVYEENEEEQTAPTVELESMGYASRGRHARTHTEDEGDDDKVEIAAYEDPVVVDTARSPSIFSRFAPRRRESVTPPELIGALWHIVIFQIAFICILVLAGLTTWIDLAKNRETPSAFGTQHVALVLAGWGPLFVFGHIPAVRYDMFRRLRRR